MDCPTCGKRVPKNQQICPFCGSLAAEIQFKPKAPEFVDVKQAAEPQFGNWEMHPKGPVFEAQAPVFEAQGPVFEGQEASQEAARGTSQSPPPQESAAPSGPLPRRPVPLFRVLVILAFLLFPLVSTFLRHDVFERPSASPPVLREAVFCEDYAAGSPVNPRNVFSLRQDSQVVLYSQWRGSRQGHAVTMQWYTPQGTLLPGPMPATRYRIGSGEFAAIGILPLRSAAQPGLWTATVLMDGQLRASLKLQVTE